MSGGDNPLASIPDPDSGVIQGDFDADGDVDVLAFDDENYDSFTFYANNGSGSFSAATGADNPFSNLSASEIFFESDGTYVADFDGDGDVDIWDAEGSSDSGDDIYLENVNGSYTSSLSGGDNPLASIPDPTVGVIVGDFDADGDVDVLAYDDESYNSFTFYANDGSGSFSAATGSNNPFSSLSVSDIFYESYQTYVADFDGDGDVDIWDFEGSNPADGQSIYLKKQGSPNTAPTFTAGSSTSLTVDEDVAATSLSSQLEVDDPDGGQTLEWTVSAAPSNGTLSGFPTTESSGGTVQPSSVTYEPNTDVSGSDAFDVQVSDGNGGSATITVNVTVDNLPPAFNSSSTASFAENGTGTALDVNADNGGDGSNDSGVDYSITGGPDGGAFSIDTSTGELGFTSAPDFESPTDSDGQNDYVIDVTADDGESSSNTTTQTITITVTDVNEPPAVTTNGGLSLDEGATAAIGPGTLSASDEDAGDGASALTFSVTSAVSNGTLFVDGSGGGTDDGTLDGESGLGTGSFTQATLDNGNLLYAHDGSETTADSFTFDLTDDDGAGPTGVTFSVSITAQNDAPTISALSDQTIQEDATLSAVSFTVDDPETSDLSGLTLSGTSSNTTLVPNSNISFTGPDASGNASVTVDPAPNESGTATITVTVDDGGESNNTASDSFTLTVNAVPDLTITDGASSNLDFSGSVSPGTSDNPVGILALSAGQAGALFEAVTVTNNAPGVEGISAARLYWSSDQALDPGSDTELGAVTTDASSAPSAISFGGFSQSIPTSARYAILAIDVQGGATGDVQFELAQTSDLSVPGGEIATVNGTSASTFSALPLSNGTTALPVELAGFDAQASGSETVRLRWETASETGNAEFDIQRRVKASRRDASPPDKDWQTVGSVDGAGTTTEARSYAFTDTGVPYDADSLTYRLKQVDTDGSVSYSEARTVARGEPQQVQLLGTFPNPARSRTTVRFAVPERSDPGSRPGQRVTLRLYDVLGRQVRTVRSSAEAGRHELQLDTGGLASGTYFLRLTAGSTAQTQKLTVVQ